MAGISNKPRLVFMGTPEFAVPSLEKLFNAGYEIAAVITAPDRPAGRGMRLQESEVKKFALSKGLKVLQPLKLKDPDFIEELKSLRADLQVVVAFRMLPEIVWNMPPLGTINVHASLLPQYRGAAPINWAIINGETRTGITTFKLQHEIDTGNILMQRAIEIPDTETAGELHDKLKETGADLLLATLDALSAGSLSEIQQDDLKEVSDLKHAPKINSDTCEIDWNRAVKDVYNLVRGLSPYPAAFTYLDEKKLKIFSGEITDNAITIPPGAYQTDNNRFLWFACKDYFLSLKEIQLEGKKRMKVAEFLRGWRPQ